MKRKLKEVCNFYSGTGFPVIYQGNNEGELPFYKVGDIANNVTAGNVYLSLCNNYISYDVAKDIKGTVIPADVVVFAKIGEALKLNRRAITACDCLIDNNAMGIGAKPEFLNSMYFYFYMKNLKMESLAESTTVPSVRKTKLEEIEMNVPTIEEQLNVVELLSKLQKIIHGRQNQLEKLDDLIKARFIEMFGEPFHSLKWPVKELKEISESLVDGSNVNPAYYESDEQVLFLRIQNVWRNEFRLDDSVYISQKVNLDEYYETSLKTGDLLITKIGRYYTKDSSLGRVSVYRGENDRANYSNNIMRVRLKDNMNSEFVNILLNLDDYQSYIKRTSNGGTDKRALSKSLIGGYPIIVPPKALQEEFETFVKQVDKSKVAVQKSLDEAQLLFDSLMQKYFG